MAGLPKAHVIYRLILAKSLFKKAIEACSTNVDTYSISHGVITLHDALDNFVGAIASHLGIPLSHKSHLMDIIKAIESHQTITLISTNEISQLNTTRNNIKHQGIVPNIAFAKTLIAPAVAFFQQYTQQFFGLNWDFVSLSDLIRSKPLQKSVKDIETLIDKGQYKEALDAMAIVRFQVFDESLLRITLDPTYDLSPPSSGTIGLRASTNIFPDHRNRGLLYSDISDRAKYLEKGIDRQSMREFIDLTARVGFDNAKDFNYILDHGHEWGEPNWTREIAVHCLDFLVDAIIKHQGKDAIVKARWLSELHTITALEDIPLKDKNGNPTGVFAKDEVLTEALLMGRRGDKWEIYDDNDRIIQYTGDSGEEVFGFFTEGDENKIKFISTTKHMRDEDDNWSQVAQIIYKD